MEVSVGFTDGTVPTNKEYEYGVDESPLGKVYYPSTGVMVEGDIEVIYEVKPWLTTFKVKGLRALPSRRLGGGMKRPKYFAQLLVNIYPNAFDEYKANKEKNGKFDSKEYFLNVNSNFMTSASDELFKMYVGFLENIWRDGNENMLEVLELLLGEVLKDERTAAIFDAGITREFKESEFLIKIMN